jgi:hypothetical protein
MQVGCCTQVCFADQNFYAAMVMGWLQAAEFYLYIIQLCFLAMCVYVTFLYLILEQGETFSCYCGVKWVFCASFR